MCQSVIQHRSYLVLWQTKITQTDTQKCFRLQTDAIFIQNTQYRKGDQNNKGDWIVTQLLQCQYRVLNIRRVTEKVTKLQCQNIVLNSRKDDQYNKADWKSYITKLLQCRNIVLNTGRMIKTVRRIEKVTHKVVTMSKYGRPTQHRKDDQNSNDVSKSYT